MTPRKLKVATVQMDATPSPVDERLDRAERLVSEAVRGGAQLVVLPELFNTGYDYTPANYALSEEIDGRTVSWMRDMAADHQIYLAGTLMLRDVDEVYNSALLFAPDGQYWRYDKQFPFLWERAFFREGHGPTIAKTELGDIGMLICWDSAHPEAWKRYAGQVDMMLVMSSPPRIASGELVWPDGARMRFNTLGLQSEYDFTGPDMNTRAAWMQVPVVHASASGAFKSPLPLAQISVGVPMLLRPSMWSRWKEADTALLECGYAPSTKIINEQGETIAHVEGDGDGCTLAEITLADEKPKPERYQPPMQHTDTLTYLFADVVAPALLAPIYQRGVRRQWGAEMAPMDFGTRVWMWSTAAAAALGFFTGRKLGDK